MYGTPQQMMPGMPGMQGMQPRPMYPPGVQPNPALMPGPIPTQPKPEPPKKYTRLI
jgi:hypothetical protein